MSLEQKMPDGVIVIPRTHPLSWIMMFYALPKEMFENLPEYRQLPRNMRDIQVSEKYMRMINCDDFLIMIWSLYAWMVWHCLRVPGKNGEYRPISLGVSMKLPKGYEAHVAPRSSTFKKWGILMVNSVGVVDESYCGEKDIWYFVALATRDTHIEKGDRICQFRIMENQPRLQFTRVEHLESPDRGGFGSTGK